MLMDVICDTMFACATDDSVPLYLQVGGLANEPYS